MVVHYGNMIENAFWNGHVAFFGDGGSAFYPLVILDVVVYEWGIAGAAAEAYMKESDWLEGYEAFNAEGEALRYFIDPTLDGRSLGHMDEYCQSVDVHYNSGLYNRVYYLLTTTPGWNARMSFMVFATANQLYWTPDSSFNDGACGTMQAARDLGFNDQDVLAAFNTVGINPCGPRFEGMHSTTAISGVHNETLFFYYDLEQETNLLKFEASTGWWYWGEYTMSVETPSGDIIATSSVWESLNVLDPEVVSLLIVRADHVLEDNFIWVNSSTSGSFSLPQDVVDAGRTIGIRVESIVESDAEPPVFGINYEEEVNVNLRYAQMMSTKHSFGKRFVSDTLICSPKAGVYNYLMTREEEWTAEDWVMKVEILLMPALV